ncbi:acyl-CoA synthetase [Seonamhaeicola sp.]|uniref:acyl-CoA synthetase n=1 Tax=Seonamhaeicola sp. TaxID=1912245 RepID=UPI0026291F10|nr:acyl-CoA synthetase [Seonamhaeicola sp.]
MINLIERATTFKNRAAVKSNGQTYTYSQLLEASKNVALTLLNGQKDLEGARIAFLVPSGFEYVCIQWGIWRAGGIAVPLCEKHPLPSIEYVINDTRASAIIFSKAFESFLAPLSNAFEIRFIPSEHFDVQDGHLPDIDPVRSAMILYTSGTTGNPKGVVTTHRNIQHQITSLTTSWEWDKNDHILNVLPMHHLHGILNVTSCALWSGACCEFLPKFDAGAVFSIFCNKQVNVFMAVPTIYFKLIAHWKTLKASEQKNITEHLKKFRLMVSGSAALPVSVLKAWRDISGQTLLERYGMTEIGMAISNPYRGERKPGHIGQALQGVDVRLRNENDEPVVEGVAGEIQVKGANVFKEYWKRPKETKDAFTADGWFKTGDIGLYKDGSYKILGRNSIDIIKSGGYKISALEIEEVLRTHPEIKDCGVVGIPDLEWGEVIGASLILESGTIDMEQLKVWLQDKLPAYKAPRRYIFQDDLPRNVMGKVTKKKLAELFIKG